MLHIAALGDWPPVKKVGDTPALCKQGASPHQGREQLPHRRTSLHEGTLFHDLRAFFKEQYTELAEIVDDVAERARSLGGPAHSTLAAFLQSTHLKERSGQFPQAREMVANLPADHKVLIRALRADLETCAEKYQDLGTNDFLAGLMEKYEKMAWVLRASLG